MRRMVTDKQVVNIVNKAIDEGEITTGGLSPEDKAKLENSLQLPENAPIAQELVGITTSKEQNALGLAAGLGINDQKLDTKIAYIGLGSGSLTSDNVIDADIYAKLSNSYYDAVIIGEKYVKAIVFFKDTSSPSNPYIADYVNGNIMTSPDTRGFGVDKVQPLYHATIQLRGDNKIRVTQSALQLVRFTDTYLNFGSGTSGKLSSSNLNKLKDNCSYFPCAYAVKAANDYGVIFHLTSYNANTYAIFKNIPDSEKTTQYELKVTMSDGSWTLTSN